MKYNGGEDQEKLDALADRVIKAFLDSPAASPQGTILGIEEELRVVLDPDLPDLLARVDLVVQDEDALTVTDFKTSRSRWSEQKAIESADQLVLYGTTVGGMSHDLSLPVKLQFAVITKAKTPVVQELNVIADANRVKTMKQTFAAVWQAITGGNFYPSPSPQACCTCQFKSRCPVFAGHPIG